MALVVLLVSAGLDIQFHYCSEAHELSGSLSLASEPCSHCHDHGIEATANTPDQLQLKAKSCCEDFDSKIQFTDSFLSSSDHHSYLQLQPFVALFINGTDLLSKIKQPVRQLSNFSSFGFFSGKERLLFFSSLRLNPLVF
ncbi:MAG: hypothetical protein K6A28_07015 [Bacteroidales bacterium]|nr:hypothetical protein [Bacteroidales bacterium]